MALARGVPHAEHPPFEYKDIRNLPFLDQGWQERRFWLTANPGTTDARSLDRESQEWQIPAEPMLDNPHPGTKPWRLSLFSVKQTNIEVLALKPAENGKGTILRLRETAGRKTRAQFTLRGKRYSATLPKWSVATFLVPHRGNTLKELNGLEDKIH
jgi:alpha-mannosidase